MKSIKLVFLAIILMSIPAYAIEYKSVFVERGDKSSVMDYEQAKNRGYFKLSTEEQKQWVVVQNHNSHPVKVIFEYKLGHKDAPWESYSDEGGMLKMDPKSEEIIFLGEHIKGLRIVYVDVDKSEATQKALRSIGNAAISIGDFIKNN
ncbi:MAG: hypothetical protein IJN02_07250 [Bacteroidales bacterium]|nr:hypothetical protein [Bacteroidales bacterium]